MARKEPESAARRTPSRVTKAPVQRQAAPRRTKSRRDRRQFWIQVTAGFLVVMMLLPIVIAFL